MGNMKVLPIAMNIVQAKIDSMAAFISSKEFAVIGISLVGATPFTSFPLGSRKNTFLQYPKDPLT